MESYACRKRHAICFCGYVYGARYCIIFTTVLIVTATIAIVSIAFAATGLSSFSLGGLFNLSSYSPHELCGKHAGIGRLKPKL